MLGEYAADESATFAALEKNIALFRTIDRFGLQAAVSVKLSELGALIDRDLCREHVLTLISEAASRNIGFEIDMEGAGMVPFTLQTARFCRKQGYPVTVTIQAYLDRTIADLSRLQKDGVRVRLVKGAYRGDIDGYEEIRDRLKRCIIRAQDGSTAFAVGTQDPEIIGWMAESLQDERHHIHLGFLMGLADQTKEDLAGRGWNVWEYLPIGSDTGPYSTRRERYLAELREMGKEPLP